MGGGGRSRGKMGVKMKENGRRKEDKSPAEE